jgi:hypothetical protein
VQNVPKIISSRRSPVKKQLASPNSGAHEEEAKPMVEATKFCGILQASARTKQVGAPVIISKSVSERAELRIPVLHWYRVCRGG